ncbi:MAG: IS4 family transposase [Moorea sp. SIO2B7]|nr:IS4 family transposase [Moorena sp. SIO2B7]
MDFLSSYKSHFTQFFTPTQFEALRILLWLLMVHKQVIIERLAACFPLPILYDSRRKHIQRFLVLSALSVSSLWFSLIKVILYKEFKIGSCLIITIDRTQWQYKNVFVIAVIWKKRALPIYWNLLSKKGASNLSEQQALIKPVLPMFKNYELVIIGHREFQSIKLGYWLKQKANNQKLFFAFRQKQGTLHRKNNQGYQSFSDLNLAPGMKMFLTGVSVTKEKGFGKFNVGAYWKRKYIGKQEKQPWFILTNLNSLEGVDQVYRARAGIEAMFKDCKTGGYNLEGSKANTQRLTSLILLIAIAYTSTSLKGKIFRQTNQAKYLARLTEKSRRGRRHSNFWLGLYGSLWINAWEFCSDFIQIMMNNNPQKLTNYQRGLNAMSLRELAI